MTKYYLVEANYVGPNKKDSDGNRYPHGELFIQTCPGTTNMSHEERVTGWLGTTNDISQTAHGEFNALEDARAAADALGYTEADDVGCDDPDVIEMRLSEQDALEQWEAEEWLEPASASDLHIAAGTTDERLADIADDLQADALADGRHVHDLCERLTEIRDELRHAAEFEIKLGEMAAEYGVSLEEQGFAGCEGDYVRVYIDDEGWHVSARGLDLRDEQWAPKTDAQAEALRTRA
jgi:hypothetical protein